LEKLAERERKSGFRTGSAVQRSHAEPAKYWGFSAPLGDQRKFTKAGLAERAELPSNLLLWMPLGLQGLSDLLDMRSSAFFCQACWCG
jgi:hypothetical protein